MLYEVITLDGFPRTLAQAEALNELMATMQIGLDKVISLNVPDELIVGRITGRRVCSKCGASFHVEFNPSKEENVCDYCGGELIIRKDDNAETVKSRLEAYHAQTAPLIDFYTKMGVFTELDGTKDVSVITSYSIHYTKLYEAGIILMFERTIRIGDVIEISDVLKGTRITSYNVCYTKLLRLRLKKEVQP